MKAFDHETRVRDALADLAAADAVHVPSFESVLAHRRSRVPSPARRTYLWTALAAAAVAVVTVYRISRPLPVTVPKEVLALAAWTPPTDVLLRGAMKHLPTQSPRFGASLLDTLNGDYR